MCEPLVPPMNDDAAPMASLVRSTQAPVVFTMTSAVKSNTSPVSSSRSWTVVPVPVPAPALPAPPSETSET